MALLRKHREQDKDDLKTEGGCPWCIETVLRGKDMDSARDG